MFLVLVKWFLNCCKIFLGCFVVLDVYIIEVIDFKLFGCWNFWCERLCCFLIIGWMLIKEIFFNKVCVLGVLIIVLICVFFNWKVSLVSVKCVFKNNNFFFNFYKVRIEKYNFLLFLLNKVICFFFGVSICWYVVI